MRRTSLPQLQPTINELVSTINELRRVVDDLRPTDLSVVSLREAIASYARARTHGSGVVLQIVLPDDVAVPEWAARDVLRVAQEAINNAVRHGMPKHLGVYLYRQDEWVILEVTDDGPGFDIDHVVLGGGILGMRERATAQGGELEVTSVPEEGTMIRMLVPAASREGREGSLETGGGRRE
jgi:two-component system sensor histidine kinase UhpB